jgi:hypothetical protein
MIRKGKSEEVAIGKPGEERTWRRENVKHPSNGKRTGNQP